MSKTVRGATGAYPHTAALLDGSIKPEGFDVEFVDVGPTISAAFRRMVRGGEFDFCELGITSVLAGWEHHNDFVLIPAFPAMEFPFKSIAVNRASGITRPKDLEGQRVACRTYTVTSVVWARGALSDLYGVDLDSITWVINDEEHEQQFEWPANVEYRAGADLAQLLETGEVAAGFGVSRGESEAVGLMFPDAGPIEQSWYQSARVVPINHAIALKRSVVEDDPSLPEKLYRYFLAGKSVGLANLDRTGDVTPAEKNLLARARMVGGDPIPYGIEANQLALETVLRYSVEQHIMRKPPTFEELFAPGNWD